MIKQDQKEFMNVNFEERFFQRTILSTLIISALIFLYGLSFNWRWAVIYLTISFLTIANFFLLYLILKRLLLRRAKYSTLLLVFVKFFIIFGAGLFFLLKFGFSLSAFLAGFNTLFLVIILRCFSAYLFPEKMASGIKSNDT